MALVGVFQTVNATNPKVRIRPSKRRYRSAALLRNKPMKCPATFEKV